MSGRVINPDSTVLEQVNEHWQKLAALIVWKCVRRGTVRITEADIDGFQAEFAPGIGVLLTHGQLDALEFSLVDEARAREIAAWDATRRGHA